jgi:hypothetical protein
MLGFSVDAFGYTTGENGEYNFVRTGSDRDWQLFEAPKRSQFEDGRSAWTESLLDPRPGQRRRIMVGWVPPGLTAGYSKPFPGFVPLWHMCSLLRDVRYDSRFKQLVTSPIAEYESLRTGSVGSLQNVTAEPGIFIPVGKGGRQLDLEVVFALPTSAVEGVDNGRMGVAVLRSADGANVTEIYIEQGSPPPPSPPPYAHYMPHTDLPGADLYYFGVNYSDPHACEADCAANSTCKACTYVGGKHQTTPYPVPRCCFKSKIPLPQQAPSTITSGVINLPPTPPPAPPAPPTPAPVSTWTLTINGTSSGAVPGHVNKFPIASRTFALAADETTVSLRVVIDRSIVEAFAQGGRAVVTATAYAPATANGAGVLVAGFQHAVTVINATAHSMGCAWVEKLGDRQGI